MFDSLGSGLLARHLLIDDGPALVLLAETLVESLLNLVAGVEGLGRLYRGLVAAC